jgi:large subunit ribosomal protein L10
MKASMAKAARTFDALRIKMEASAPAPVVSEPEAKTAEAAVPAEAVTEAVVEAPAAEAAPEVVPEGTEN